MKKSIKMSLSSFLKRLSTAERYNTPDSLRGICILGMVLYHTFFWVVTIFELQISYPLYFWTSLVRDLGAALFMLISGFCFSVGTHHLKHILVLNGIGLGITLGSWIVMPESPVIFGILTFMGCACLIMTLTDRFMKKLPPLPFAILSFILFFVFISVSYGYIGYGGFLSLDPPLVIAKLPSWLYANIFTAALGFPYDGFSSGDYFPLLPWIFAYFCGYFLYRFISPKASFNKIMGLKIPFLCRWGRYSVFIYIGHVPAVIGIVYLAKIIVG